MNREKRKIILSKYRKRQFKKVFTKGVKNQINKFIGGFLMGLANIVPGLSGSTIAVCVGMYDDFIDGVSNLFSKPKQSLKKLAMYLLGIAVGAICGIFALSVLLAKFPLFMSFLFAALIICGLPRVISEINFKKSKWYEYLISLFFMGILIVTSFFISGKNLDIINDNVKASLVVFGTGVVAAVAMLIPGISGASTLQAMGIYNYVLNIVKKTLENLKNITVDFNFLLVVILAIGVIFGILMFAKVIDILNKKFHRTLYITILGLMLGSIASVLINGFRGQHFELNGAQSYVYYIGLSAIFFIIGLPIGGFIMNVDKKFNFKVHTKKYEEPAIGMLKDLIKYKSVLKEFDPNSDEPFGRENAKALSYMLIRAKAAGFETYNCDNYAGHIEYGEGSEIVGILGHLDVVPATGNWTSNPFELAIRDGKMYGRGVLDDKGPVVAAYFALRLLKDNKIKLSKRVRLIVGCDEESGSRCLSYYLEHAEKPTMAFSPDADFPLIYGEKGILSFDINGKVASDDIISIECGDRTNIVPDLAILEVKNPDVEGFKKYVEEKHINAEYKDGKFYFYGKASHAMQPQCGINAGELLLNYVNTIYDFEPAKYITEFYDTTGFKQNCAINDPMMHELTINLGVVKYENGVIRLGYNLRVPTDDHLIVIKAGFKSALSEFKNLKLSDFRYSPRHFVSPDSKLVTSLMEAYQQSTGDTMNGPITIGGGTYARLLDNAVAFGPQFPGTPDLCHQPDENIKVEDFVKWIEIYANAIYNLAK